MAIYSGPFGGTRLTGDDARAFERQIGEMPSTKDFGSRRTRSAKVAAKIVQANKPMPETYEDIIHAAVRKARFGQRSR